jgi:hypothetical protein
MAGPGNEAKFTVSLDGNAEASARAAADAMESLKTQINGSQSAIKNMSAQMKALAGDSKEVKAAKDDLSKKIDAERVAMSKATLAQIKAGEQNKRALEVGKKIADQKKKLADKFKDEKAAQDKASASISKAGGPLGMLHDKFEGLKGILGGASSGTALFAAGATALIGVIVALAATTVAAGIALAKFVLKSADAARSAKLLREAAMGANAKWGKNAGEQIDLLATKVPTAKARLDEMGRSLAKQNIGGQTWVDTMNAVAQASAALGDDAGSKLQEFVTRGRQLGRMQINPLELIGTGVDFKDVATELSKSMKVGVKEAQAALFEGRVKLADGAAALRAAVEKKFGGINLRQMISLENLSKKLGEAFEALTKDVDMEPILKALHEMADIFSLSTHSGQALKQIVEVFGKELGASFTSTTPIAKKFIYGMIIGAQQLVIAYLQVRNQLKKTFGDTEVLKNANVLSVALTAGKVAMYGMAYAAAATAGFIAAAAAPFVVLGVAVWNVYKSFKTTYELMRDTDWNAIGLYVADGITNGLKTGAIKVYDGVKALAKGVKDTFKDALQIKSPSKVFEGYGVNIAAGTAKGVDKGAPQAQAAVGDMVAPPAAGGGGKGGITIHAPINVVVQGGDKDIAAQVQGAVESAVEQLTKSITTALQGGGVPVPG